MCSSVLVFVCAHGRNPGPEKSLQGLIRSPQSDSRVPVSGGGGGGGFREFR